MKRAKKNYSKQWKMWYFILGVFLFMQPGFSQVDGSVSLEFPNQEEAMQTAKETVKAYETGNWEVLRKNVQPDALFYNLGSFDSLTLDQTINYWKRGRETATPVLAEEGAWLAVSVPDGPREGNWILHWGNNTLNYPNGETIRFPYHVALKISNEKVSQAHFYYDNDRITRALGYEMRPPMEREDEEANHQNDNNNRP